MSTAFHRFLLLASVIMLAASGARALPLGTIGGAADSLIRVHGGNHCDPPGDMCFEAIGSLPLADYALDGIAQIHATGAIDHAAGEIAGSALFQAIVGNGSDGSVWFHARDLFTVSGPVPGQTVSVTARLAVDGSIVIGDADGTGFVQAVLSSAPDGWDPVNGGITTSTGSGALFNPGLGLPSQATPPGSYPFDIETADTFDVVTGTAFQLVYAMQLGASTFDAFPAGDPGNVLLDALNTARLSFDLPGGHSITSALGYGVPEPGTWMLLASGLFGLIWAGRSRAL